MFVVWIKLCWLDLKYMEVRKMHYPLCFFDSFQITNRQLNGPKPHIEGEGTKVAQYIKLVSLGNDYKLQNEVLLLG